MVRFIFLTLLLLSQYAQAGLLLPENLSADDRVKILRIIGFGTSSKILADPYPMGGYSGIEVGLGVESVPTDDLARLGSRVSTDKSFTYPKISLAKGVYQNFDLFFHFIPFNQNTNFSEYGGLVRWCFYQAAFLPATFSLLVHGNSSNVGNLFFSQSVGADLMTGVNVNHLALYFGGGKIAANGKFLKKLNNGQLQDEDLHVDALHAFIGVSFDIEPFFLAIQMDQYIDQYSQSTTSAKLGVRY